MRLRALAGAILLLLAGSAALPQTPHGSTVPVPCPSGFGGTLANLVPQFQPDLRARRSGGPPKGGASLVTTVLQSLLRFLGVVLQPLAFIIEPMVALSRAGDRVDVDPQSQTPVAMHKNKREPPWHDFVVPTAPRDLDLVVPSWRFENVKDAVEIARNGQRVGPSPTPFTTNPASAPSYSAHLATFLFLHRPHSHVRHRSRSHGLRPWPRGKLCPPWRWQPAGG